LACSAGGGQQFLAQPGFGGLRRQPDAKEQARELGVRHLTDDTPRHLEHRTHARLVNAQQAIARLHIRQRGLQRLLPARGLLGREAAHAAHLFQ